MNTPNTVDYLTLGAAIVAPILAAMTTIWSVRRREFERFELHIDWKFFGPDREHQELPFLYIQNKTSTPIIVTAIAWYRGVFRRKHSGETAIFWEDPYDLNFPYTVDGGTLGNFVLDPYEGSNQLAKIARRSKVFGIFSRPAIWIGITTASGRRKYVGGERAIPWSERPEWTKAGQS